MRSALASFASQRSPALSSFAEASSHLQLSVKVGICRCCFPFKRYNTDKIAADLVQDMYLRELKNYKPTPIKPSDAEGQVQKFAMPQAPKSPEEADISNDLKAYETQQVEVEGQSSESGAAPVEQDWFEEEEEEEEAAHH